MSKYLTDEQVAAIRRKAKESQDINVRVNIRDLSVPSNGHRRRTRRSFVKTCNCDQNEEYLLHTQEVTGSSPVAPTTPTNDLPPFQPFVTSCPSCILGQQARPKRDFPLSETILCQPWKISDAKMRDVFRCHPGDAKPEELDVLRQAHERGGIGMWERPIEVLEYSERRRRRVSQEFWNMSSANESCWHKNLKYSAFLYLSLFTDDARFEADSPWGRADIFSEHLNLGIECGNTPPQRALHMLGGNCYMAVIPYDEPETLYLLASNSVGRLYYEAYSEIRNQRCVDVMEAHFARMKAATPTEPPRPEVTR